MGYGLCHWSDICVNEVRKGEVVDAAKQWKGSKSLTYSQVKAPSNTDATPSVFQAAYQEAVSIGRESIAQPCLLGNGMASKRLDTLTTAQTFELPSSTSSKIETRCCKSSGCQSEYSIPAFYKAGGVLIPGSSRNLQISSLYYSSYGRPTKKLRCQPERFTSRHISRRTSHQ